MPEPRTHYQVTFTARQGVLFFGIALGALAGAYFLGVATGFAGRPSAEGDRAAASTPPPAEAAPTTVPLAAATKPPRAAEAPTRPAPTSRPESRTPAPAIAAREPDAAGGIQFFEDRPDEATPAATAGPKKAGTPAPAASGGFWIQILSSTSESEAQKRRTTFASRGYRAVVSRVHGPKGPTLYRVRIGPYRSREEAAKASEALVRKEKVRTWIVPPAE